MITVKIVLDQRSVKKDGTSPLKLRLLYYRKSNQISLGYSILAKDWDTKKERIKASCQILENVNRINAILLKKKQQAFDVLNRLDEEGKLMVLPFKEVKALVTNQHLDVMVLAFGDQLVAQLKGAAKFSTAKVYQVMLNSLRKFNNNKDLPLKQINYEWIKRYEYWYLSNGNSYNGLAVMLRTLRATFNKAIKLKRISKDYYPFDVYKIRTEKTQKRAISYEDFQKIKAFEPSTDSEKLAQTYFLMSFYMMGASFADMAFMKLSNRVNGRIHYKRRKTGKPYNIPISSPLQALLDPFLQGKSENNYILNVIQSQDLESQIKEIDTALKQYNITLKTLGKACNIETPLTSYVARHSYATIAKRKGVPTAVISEALGHETERVTQVYLDSFENEVVDEYHELIIA